ncbi:MULTISPECIES: hypothetical protein [unclassified Actinobaculum]|uniref:hypothetical protein n=1 Tax=unclassified Actinobaculum TaxID=2609299 RepID=UPI000D5271EA|nr:MULTISPECIES: hypothetical protein [unclassified Actinobaculum]AWE42527.1 hypothetical protein DDD63_06930 [Actinobaculum sp. 313]RTE48750.1 hypothetical protein EKN07_08535 [Actinobaculum sp. 352]
MQHNRSRFTSIIAICAFALGACSTSPSESSGNSPQFSGPWAEEFESAYNSTDSEFAKTILSDGEITEAEIKEAEQAMTSCLEEKGYTDVEFYSDGRSQNAVPPGKEDSEEGDRRACEQSTGYDALWIYYEIKVNPNNEDWEPLVVQCLKDNNLVESSFTPSDLDRLYETGEIENHRDQEEWTKCETDPLGLG